MSTSSSTVTRDIIETYHIKKESSLIYFIRTLNQTYTKEISVLNTVCSNYFIFYYFKNPNVEPLYGMVDFYSAEIVSLQDIIRSIKIFLCDFHREQAWQR